MPFAFIIVGIALVVSGVRGTDDDLITLLEGDFNGTPNFISWMLAILAIGSLGYIEAIKPVSRAMLVLIIIVLFLKKGQGFFDQFIAAVIKQQPAQQQSNSGDSNSNSNVVDAIKQIYQPSI